MRTSQFLVAFTKAVQGSESHFADILHQLLGAPPEGAGWSLEDAKLLVLLESTSSKPAIEIQLREASHHLFGSEAMVGEYSDWFQEDYRKVLGELRGVLGEPASEGAGILGPASTRNSWLAATWNRAGMRIRLELYLPMEDKWRVILHVEPMMPGFPTTDRATPT